MLDFLMWYALIGVALFVFCEFMTKEANRFNDPVTYLGATLVTAVIWPWILVESIWEMRKGRK